MSVEQQKRHFMLRVMVHACRSFQYARERNMAIMYVNQHTLVCL